MVRSVSEEYDRLINWSKSLLLKLENDRAEFEETLSGKRKILDNCPSRASMGHLIFRGVEQSIDEVNAAKRDLMKSMWHIHGEQK